jgi:hypothetical protein
MDRRIKLLNDILLCIHNIDEYLKENNSGSASFLVEFYFLKNCILKTIPLFSKHIEHIAILYLYH